MKKLFFSISVIGFCLTANAQDIYYSNQQQSLLGINPSFAGSNGFVRLQTNQRARHAYFSSYASYDMYLKKIKSGIAINYNHDDVYWGLYKSDVFNVSFARHFYLCDDKLKLVPSVQLGGFVKHLNRSKLTFGHFLAEGDAYAFVSDRSYNPVPRKTNFDASAGFMLQHKNFIFGTSIDHLTQPDGGLWGVEKVPARFNVHSSYNFIFSEKHLLNVSARYMRQQKLDQFQLTTNAVLFRHYVIGAGWQIHDVICANIGFHHNFFNVILTGTYNPDWGAYTWEMGASYTLRNKDQRKQLVAMENW